MLTFGTDTQSQLSKRITASIRWLLFSKGLKLHVLLCYS